MNTLIHSISIVTLDEENRIIKDGYVTIKDGYFQEVSEGKPTEVQLNKAEKVIDGNGKWLMPGLINTHTHLGSTLLRGVGDDIPLMEWLETVMWPNEAKFTEKIVTLAASLAMVEMIKTGTTTFLDMYHLSMDKIGELAIQSGMRAVLCRGMIGNCSDDEQDAKLAEAIHLFKTFHGENNGTITVALSPHAPYTCPPSFLQKVVATAEETNMWVHTHLSETRGEVERHVKEYGLRPVKHLNELGFFDVPVLIAHGVHLDDEEIDILAEKNVAVAHNPMSNLKLGSGIAPIPKMMKRGVTISLGTDSTASNNNLDMFEEMRFAALIHKGVNEDPTATKSNQILKMATSYGAKALQIKNLGQIRSGWLADFILIDGNRPHLCPQDESQIMSHLVYSAKGADVTDSFVRGEQIMKDGHVLFLDEEKIIFEAKNFQLP